MKEQNGTHAAGGQTRSASANSSRDIAYRIIRDKIINFELKPGEPVSDKLLAEQLGMSRTPVREALIILSTVNMVIMRPQAGTFIAPIDEEWLQVEQFSRGAMEKAIITAACTVGKDEMMKKYSANIAEYIAAKGSAAPDRLETMLSLDNEFHRIAFVAVGREKNLSHMRSYMQHIERLRMLSLLMDEENHIADDHAHISEAVCEGDIISAQYWLDRHLSRYVDSLKLAKATHPEFFEID